MANVELDQTITDKLKEAFKVSDEDIQKLLTFFNGTLKPALKAHYLSHLVTSIEEMINESQKKEFLEYIRTTGNTNGWRTAAVRPADCHQRRAGQQHRDLAETAWRHHAARRSERQRNARLGKCTGSPCSAISATNTNRIKRFDNHNWQ